MRARRVAWTGILAGVGMFVLILDAKTALLGAKQGVDLCIGTVIPSLFPFIILSVLLNGCFLGKRIKPLVYIGRLCGIPAGCESILLIGLLGGYPVGAQSVAQAYRNGQLSRNDACRLLGFCNNAGPAFIFGMLSVLFTNPAIPWAIWLIHILSALITGMVLPGRSNNTCVATGVQPVSLQQALQRSIRIMANICGWVILFRVLIRIFDRWFLWLFSDQLKVLFVGILELTNGCVDLQSVSSESVRFIMCACMLSFGGLCVMMQTSAVTADLGIGLYFPGKLLQCVISFLLATVTQYVLFPTEQQINISPVVFAVITAILGLFVSIKRRKKVVAFPMQM